MPKPNKIPKRYQPKGYEILYEDKDIVVGNKEPGYLTVSALLNKDNTIHSALNQYVRKGNPKSHKRVYVVHRLDQATSGVLLFAKSEPVQLFLKDNWSKAKKYYYAVVHGRLKNKEGLISSYLAEDEDYFIHSSQHKHDGKLAKTGYTVEKETARFSLLKIDLLTGRKNQIRVHLADEGHPVVGDTKYGDGNDKHKRLALHAHSLSFFHPMTGKPVNFEAPIPEYFNKLLDKN